MFHTDHMMKPQASAGGPGEAGLYPDAAAVRTFATGATRDLDQNKIDYDGFLSPLAIRRFGEYMHKHRIQPDGKLRASDNWQLGIPREQYMKSMWRHFFEVWEGHRADRPLAAQSEALAALLFNVQGMLHEVEKARQRPAVKQGEGVLSVKVDPSGTVTFRGDQ